MSKMFGHVVITRGVANACPFVCDARGFGYARDLFRQTTLNLCHFHRGTIRRRESRLWFRHEGIASGVSHDWMQKCLVGKFF